MKNVHSYGVYMIYLVQSFKVPKIRIASNIKPPDLIIGKKDKFILVDISISVLLLKK